MKIGIDASFLRKPGTGIGQVTTNFLKKLVEFSAQGGLRRSWQSLSGMHEAEFILYTEEETEMRFPEYFRVKPFLPTWWKRDDVLRRYLWEKQVAKEALKDGCDIFISLYQSATSFSKYKIQNTKYGNFEHLMIVHDIIPKLFPKYLGKLSQKMHWKAIERGIANAGHIIVISEHTKQDLIRELGIPERNITVSYPGISENFDTVCTDERCDAVLQKYGVTRGYIYHGGGLELRKNGETLLKAYQQLTVNNKQKNLQTPKLIISGRIFDKKNKLATDVMGLVAELRLQEHVKVLGFVPDEDLPALYRGASMFVYPSLYEGLGLPPLEAMSQGTPVIASNTSSLPEACGDAALFVYPNDADDLMKKMSLLLGDAALRDSLREKGFEQLKKFSWKIFVRRVME